jgi:hypothetical protein
VIKKAIMGVNTNNQDKPSINQILNTLINTKAQNKPKANTINLVKKVSQNNCDFDLFSIKNNDLINAICIEWLATPIFMASNSLSQNKDMKGKKLKFLKSFCFRRFA